MSLVWIGILLTNLPLVKCQGVSDDVSKAFVTLAVLCGALIISVIVARIFDYCYDRSTLRDDASDISEHTRKIIRQRLAVMKFAKKEKTKKTISKVRRASHVLRVWSAKSKRRQSELNGGNKNDTDVVIDMTKEISSGESKETSLTGFPATLKVPTEDEAALILSEHDDDGVLYVLNMNENQESRPNQRSTPVLVKQSSSKVAPVQNQATATKTHSGGTSASVPRAQTKSTAPSVSPKFYPLSPKRSTQSKPMSVPQLSIIESPQTDLLEHSHTNSPSPPKILIKQPTEIDFEPKLSYNLLSTKKTPMSVVSAQPQQSTSSGINDVKGNKKQISFSAPEQRQNIEKTNLPGQINTASKSH